MSDTMTPKQRWLAAIHLQPVDRLPFWPKLNGSYPKAQESPFRDMDLDAIHDWIGSDKHTGIPGCIREVRTKTSVETTQSDGVMRTVYRTPHGEMEMIRRYDGPSDSWHPVAFPVRTLEDIRLMTEVFDDVTIEPDREGIERARAESERIGEDAVTANGIDESPLMKWVEWLAGVQNAHILLMEYRDEVEALLDAQHQVLLRKTEVCCEHSVADLLYLMENTSTTLISPDQYRRYCLPYIIEYAEVTRAHARNLVLHMCGHLKALLADLDTIPAQAFEAFTSPALANTTLLDGRKQCPDTCLIGGTNAMLWTEPSDVIIAEIERDLDALPHHRGIVVTSAGVMTPLCKPETIKRVCEWVKGYPANTAEPSPTEA